MVGGNSFSMPQYRIPYKSRWQNLYAGKRALVDLNLAQIDSLQLWHVKARPEPSKVKLRECSF